MSYLEYVKDFYLFNKKNVIIYRKMGRIEKIWVDILKKWFKWSLNLWKGIVFYYLLVKCKLKL